MARFISLTIYNYGRDATPVTINLDMVKKIRPHADSETVIYFADHNDDDFVVVTESYADVIRCLGAPPP